MDIKEIEFQKINLNPGDVLMVKVKGEVSGPSLDNLKGLLSELFYDNQVFVIGIDEGHDVTMEAVSQPTENVGCGSQSYCSDCNCGKKEAAEK